MATNTAHAVVRTDNMTGTDVRSQLVSLRYMGADGKSAAEIDNGNVLKIGSLLDSQREIYEGLDTAADTAVTDVVLVASVETMYDERKKNLDEFVNEEGANLRGYRLHHGDTFSVTKEALTGELAVGNTVELTKGTKLNVVKTATGATVVGSLIAEEISGRYTYYVIKVN